MRTDRRTAKSAAVDDADAPSFRTQVLQQYMPEGILLMWPSKFKRQYIIIEEISRRFEPEVVYTEREDDAMLKEIYTRERFTLRRNLADLRTFSHEDCVCPRQ